MSSFLKLTVALSLDSAAGTTPGSFTEFSHLSRGELALGTGGRSWTGISHACPAILDRSVRLEGPLAVGGVAGRSPSAGIVIMLSVGGE